MRIAFVGKGGSGKTTICAAFIKYLEKQRKPVLAIDADVNRHLPDVLGFDRQPPSLALHSDEICAYLMGARNDVPRLIGTMPPAQGSTLVRPTSQDKLVARYALRHGDGLVNLMSVGRYESADVGDSCYHGKLGTLATIMHHMIDLPDEWIIADSTAGTDGLATSLYFAYDAYIYVVEPTLKSVQVYKDFLEATRDHPRPVFVIVNKLDSKAQEQEMAFVRQHIDPLSILATVGQSDDLRRFEQGEPAAFTRFCMDTAQTMAQVQAVLAGITRDYAAYYKHLVTFHNDVAQKWANAYYNADLAFNPENAIDFASCFTCVNALEAA